jgi:cell division protein FtsL
VTPPPAHATAARVPSPATAPPRGAPPAAPPSRQPLAPSLPRRKSGPGQSGVGGISTRTLPSADAVAGRLRGVLDAPFLDRLTRGRAWIGLVAVGLIGIVFMQVSLLRLNAGIGRSIQQAQGLERENAQLRDTVSRLGSGDRIQQVASSHGLVMPPSGTFHYLTAGRAGDATRAARTMKAPINGPVVEEGPSVPKANVGAATTAATPTPASSSPGTTPASTAPATTTSTSGAPGTPPTTGAATATTPTGAGAPAQPTSPTTSSAPTTPATTQPAAPTSTPTTPPGQ